MTLPETYDTTKDYQIKDIGIRNWFRQLWWKIRNRKVLIFPHEEAGFGYKKKE